MTFLDKQALLDRQSFWENRDWDWYKDNIPFFECPDSQFNEIYYFRWQLVTKHIKYVSPRLGYMITEFNSFDPLGWSGNYNSICGSVNHHISESRWLRRPQVAADWLGFWFAAEGTQPNNYTWSAAHAAWSLYLVHGDRGYVTGLLDELIRHYESWKFGRVSYPHDNGYNPALGLYWNTGRDAAGEYNMASTQLNEELRGIAGYKIRGGAGYRPYDNAHRYADAMHIARIADLAERSELAAKFRREAEALKLAVQEQLWDPVRRFFMHRWRHDEYSQGDSFPTPSIKAGSLIWETNGDRFGGIGHQPHESGVGRGRELAGYIPWQYHLPDDNDETDPARDYASAWKFVMDSEYFYGEYGPTTAERHDPWFSVIYDECRWNGGSWPYMTSKMLEGAANLLNDYKPQQHLTRDDYFTLLRNYTRTHYKNGKPYLAESHHPDLDEWTVDRPIGYDYFHSTYNDLIITGLVGLRPREDDVLEVNPLIPDSWDYMALEDIPYRGHRVAVIWDRDGSRYGAGAGLRLFVDGRAIASSDGIGRLTATLPAPDDAETCASDLRIVNYAVNNDGNVYPQATASYTSEDSSVERVNNGLVWYHDIPVNRWTSVGSGQSSDWLTVDFGEEREIDTVKLYIYENESVGIIAPAAIALEAWREEEGWQPIAIAKRTPEQPEARRANVLALAQPECLTKLRVTLTHRDGCASGVVELEAIRHVKGESRSDKEGPS